MADRNSLSELQALERLLGVKLPPEFELKIEIHDTRQAVVATKPTNVTLQLAGGELRRKLGGIKSPVLSCW